MGSHVHYGTELVGSSRAALGRLLPLVLLLASGQPAVAGPAPRPPPPAGASVSCDVIVIGAGIAGLAAALGLQQNNTELRICIVEGRDRVGGRVHSVTSATTPGLVFEMGAAWIHGTTSNPIAALAARFNLTTYPTDWNDDKMSVGGAFLPDWQFLTNIGVAAALYSGGVASARAAAGGVDFPLYAAANATVTAQPLAPDLQAALQVLFAADEVDNGGDDTRLSGLYYDFTDQWDFDGPQVVFPGGYSGLVDGLVGELSPLTASLLALSARVSSVIVDSDSGVVTVTTNASASFTAPRAIVTLPLAVLQAGSVSFTPPLPAAKTVAIRRMGVGHFHKTYLLFDLNMWNDTQHCWLFRGANVSAAFDGPASRSWTYWLNMASTPPHAPLLVAFNTGSVAQALSELPLAALQKEALRRLADTLGVDADVLGAHLIEIVANGWDHDDLSGRGAYSYPALGALPEDANALGAPFPPSLWFAGEATSYKYPGYVHGAYLEGQRAAAQVISDMAIQG